MSMKPDQERVKQMLTETILLLCKNGLHFRRSLTVQGLLGITLDDRDIFMIHLNEVIHPEGCIEAPDQLLTDSPELQTEISSRKNDSGIVPPCPVAESVLLGQDDVSLISSSLAFHEDAAGDVTKARASTYVKSEPSEVIDDLSEQLTNETWVDESQPSALLKENSFHARSQDKNRIGGCADALLYKTFPVIRRTAGERFLTGGQDPVSNLTFGDRESDVSEQLDFQNGIAAHSMSRQETQLQMGLSDTDEFTNTHHSSSSHLTSSISYRSLALQNQFMTTNLFISRYRPKNSSDKEYHCTYPGCSLSFYARRTLLRHQTQKHGRPKSYVRYASKTCTFTNRQCSQ